MGSFDFRIIGKISAIETIAVGNEIRELASLQKYFGRGRWKKKKGIAAVRLRDGSTRRAEIHWYEAHGIGKKRMKLKSYLD